MIAGRSKVCYNKHLSCSYRYFDCFYCELIQSIIYSIRKTARVRKLKMTFELIFALFVRILLEVKKCDVHVFSNTYGNKNEIK